MANTDKENAPGDANSEGQETGAGEANLDSNSTSESTPAAMLYEQATDVEGTPLQLALSAADEWSVFPVRDKSQPLVKSGVHAASDDPDEIQSMFSSAAGRKANGVGGSCAGKIVIDVDPRSGGTVPEGLPPTRVHYSGRGDGGCHYVYHLPEGVSGLKSSTSEISPGVDIKTGEGSYVVLPGSLHPATGQRYRTNGADIATIPREVLDRVLGHGGVTNPFDGWSLQRLWDNPPEEGGRNEWLTRLAGHYAREFAPDRREEYDHKLSEANRQLRSSLDPDEVAKTADSIWSTQLDTLAEEKREAVPSPQEALASARWVQENHFTHSDGSRTLWYYGGEWWLWSERLGWFEKYTADRLQDRVALAFEHRHYMTEKGKRAWAPTPNKTLAVVLSLRAISRIEDHAKVDNGRAWVGVTGPWPAIDALPVANGLLNLRTRELIPHTPALFATSGVPAPYEARSDAPVWRGFVSVVFEKLARELVQQWFGYVLSGRTDQQKMLYLHGKGGTGKGTSHRVLEILIGGDETETVVATEINDLKQDFGMAHWVGASLVCFADADEGFNIGKQGLARLKTITGGDRMSINIKGRDYWRGVPSFRLMWLSNNPPMWAGDAGPMVRRLLPVRTTGERVDLLDSEGQSIEDLVRPELSGVLNWALDGLDLLNHRQRQDPNESPWTQSETHDEDMRNMLDSDRMTAFLDHHVPTATEEEHEVAVEAPALYELYKLWCKENGHDHPGTSAQFYAEFTKYTDIPKHRPKPGGWVGGSGKADRPYLFVLSGRRLANVSNFHSAKTLKRAT